MLDWRRHLTALTFLVAVHSQARRYGAGQHRRRGFRSGLPNLAVMILAVMMLADQPVLLMWVTVLPVRGRLVLVRHLLWRPVLLAVFVKYRPVLAFARHVPDG